MKRTVQMTAMTVAMALASAGCFGSFTLTRKLYNWNSTVSQDKWIREIIFIVLAWAPVYGLAGLGDALVFNSIEFWTGKNPITTAANGQAAPTRRLAWQQNEAVLQRLADPTGEAFVIHQFQAGQPAAGLRIARLGDMAVASTSDGTILFTAQTLPDGTLVVNDGSGRQLASYSPQDMERRVADAARR